MSYILVFTHCDVICDLLQYTRTGKCNLFVKWLLNFPVTQSHIAWLPQRFLRLHYTGSAMFGIALDDYFSKKYVYYWTLHYKSTMKDIVRLNCLLWKQLGNSNHIQHAKIILLHCLVGLWPDLTFRNINMTLKWSKRLSIYLSANSLEVNWRFW